MSEVLRQDSVDEITKLLLGRRIVDAKQYVSEEKEVVNTQKYWQDGVASDGILTLDDGTVIYVIPNQGCGGCSSGWYDLKHLASVDNIITSVRVEREQIRYEEYTYDAWAYRIFVVADATEINVLTVEGDDGNGYYGTGYELLVVRSEEKVDAEVSG